MSEVKTERTKKSLDTIVSDLTRPLKNHYGLKPWIIFHGGFILQVLYFS